MKMIFAFVALFSLQQAFAAPTPLKSGDLSLSAAPAELVSVREICPKVSGGFSCMAIGSRVSVKVNLNGCLDRLGGYSAKVEYVDGKNVIYFSAINIANEASSRARCIARSFKMVEFTVPNEGDFELVNLEFNGVK